MNQSGPGRNCNEGMAQHSTELQNWSLTTRCSLLSYLGHPIAGVSIPLKWWIKSEYSKPRRLDSVTYSVIPRIKIVIAIPRIRKLVLIYLGFDYLLCHMQGYEDLLGNVQYTKICRVIQRIQKFVESYRGYRDL